MVRSADLRRAFPGYWESRVRAARDVVGVWLLGLLLVVLAWAGFGLGAGVAAGVLVFGPFVAAAAWMRFRARPGRGARRGLPPGRVEAGTESMLDFEFFARHIRAFGPISKANFFGEPLLCIADLGVATKFFREQSGELTRLPMGFNRYVPGGAIRWAEEPRHSELRGLFSRALSSKVIQGAELEMARAGRELLEVLARESTTDTEGSRPLPQVWEATTRVFASSVLGVGGDDPAYSEVREHVVALDVMQEHPPPDAVMIGHLDRIAEIVRDRLTTRAADHPTVASELVRLAPGVLDDVGVRRNLVYLTIAPRDDVAGLLMWIVWYLANNPQWCAAVAADPQAELVDHVISETLRLDQSEFLIRSTRCPVAVGEYNVPSNWMVRVCIREIHRDPTVFRDPLRFDPDRFRDRAVGRDAFAPFGIDHKACIGEGLTRAIARAFIGELVRFDIAVARDGPRELGWNRHWVPSESFRVTLQPRASDDGAVRSQQ